MVDAYVEITEHQAQAFQRAGVKVETITTYRLPADVANELKLACARLPIASTTRLPRQQFVIAPDAEMKARKIRDRTALGCAARHMATFATSAAAIGGRTAKVTMDRESLLNELRKCPMVTEKSLEWLPSKLVQRGILADNPIDRASD